MCGHALSSGQNHHCHFGAAVVGGVEVAETVSGTWFGGRSNEQSCRGAREARVRE